MRALTEGGSVGQSEVAARGLAAIIFRHLRAEAYGTFLAAVSDRVGNDPARALAERDLQPVRLDFFCKAPARLYPNQTA